MYYTIQDVKQKVLTVIYTDKDDPTDSVIDRLKMIWSADYIKVDFSTAGYDSDTTNYGLRVLDAKTTYNTTVAVKKFTTL